MTEQFCPVCGEPAKSEHLIRPKTTGGTDVPENKCWLCDRCHLFASELQEKNGLIMSQGFLDILRNVLKVRLGTYKGIEQTWLGNFLYWICLHDGTIRYIKQEFSCGYTPVKINKIDLPPTSTIKRRRGNPGKPDVATDRLKNMIHNQGLSYRQAVKKLEEEGITFSRSAIYKRLLEIKVNVDIPEKPCKQCGDMFQPKNDRQVFCRRECDRKFYRKDGKKSEPNRD